MKLASIILPLIDNEGNDLFGEHQQLKHDLVKHWGGYTSIDTLGGWQGPTELFEGEAAVKYEVAMERADTCKFRDLAQNVCKYARQQSVMIVTANGDVEFVHAKDLTPAA